MRKITEVKIVEEINKLNLQLHQKYYAILIVTELVGVLTYKQHKNDKDLYLRKSIESYTDQLTGNKNITEKIINELIKGKVIKRVDSNLIERRSFESGKYGQAYTTELRLSGHIVIIRTKDYLVGKRSTNFIAKYNMYRDRNITWHKENIERMVCINYEKLKVYIEKKFSRKLNDSSKETIESFLKKYSFRKRKEYNYTKIFIRHKILQLLDIEDNSVKISSKCGRHYHVISNCPRELRMILSSKDNTKPLLVQLDLVNSQPVFLYSLFISHNLDVEREIMDSILEGKFYECIGKCLDYDVQKISFDKEYRSNLKGKVFSNIIFADNHIRQSSKIFKSVRKKFPKFCNAIIQLSKKFSLASQLQLTQSKLMLPIVKQFHGFGIHDSIVLCAQNYNDNTIYNAYYTILNAFKYIYDLQPKIQISNFLTGQIVKINQMNSIQTTKEMPIKVNPLVKDKFMLTKDIIANLKAEEEKKKEVIQNYKMVKNHWQRSIYNKEFQLCDEDILVLRKIIEHLYCKEQMYGLFKEMTSCLLRKIFKLIVYDLDQNVKMLRYCKIYNQYGKRYNIHVRKEVKACNKNNFYRISTLDFISINYSLSDLCIVAVSLYENRFFDIVLILLERYLDDNSTEKSEFFKNHQTQKQSYAIV